jgi:hypothetical protein
MAVSFLFGRQNTGDIQCWPINRVPWRRNLFVNVPTALVRFITGVSHNALPRESRTKFPPEGTSSTITRRKPRVIFYGEAKRDPLLIRNGQRAFMLSHTHTP